MNKKDKLKVLKTIEQGFDLAWKKKLKNYSRESKYMPFMDALIGKKRVAEYSFAISLATWFGQNSGGGYETITKILAEAAGSEVETQYEIPYSINQKTSNKVNEFYRKIRKKEISPDMLEIEKKIQKFSKKMKGLHEDKIVDVFIRDKDNNIYFIDITSPKSNMKEAAALKLKLMNWLAIAYANYEFSKVYAFVAFPYNPYHPNPYTRFSTDIFDKNRDIKFQENFWNLIAGFDVYEDLLKIINKVCKEYEKEIKNIFDKI